MKQCPFLLELQFIYNIDQGVNNFGTYIFERNTIYFQKQLKLEQISFVITKIRKHFFLQLEQNFL